MASRLTEVIVDGHDLERLTEFWCAVLGYVRSHEGEGWVAIRPRGQDVSDGALVANLVTPAIAFVKVPEHKSSKNRLHLDVTPVDRSQAGEVDRLIALGAARVSIGQQDTPWVVMADPEGNEFCVMPGLDPFGN